MIKNNRRSFFCISLFICLLSLVACDSKPVVTQETPASTPTSLSTAKFTPTLSPKPSATPSSSNLDMPAGIQVTFWHPWPGVLANLVEDMAEDFNQNNAWGIQVQVESHADALVLLEDIQQAQDAGALPHMMAASPDSLRYWYAQGLPLRDLNAYLDAQPYGFTKEELASFLPVFWKADIAGDVRLGLPAYRSGSFLMYNQSWARDLGFSEYPKTSDQFREQSCAAARANLGIVSGTGGWFYDTRSTTLLSWMGAFSGEEWIPVKGNLVFQSADNQAALEYLYDLFNADCAWVGRQSLPYEYFSRRYALLYSAASEDIFLQKTANSKGNNQDEWTLIPYPSDDFRPVVYVSGFSYAILTEAEDESLAAWLFIKYLLEAQNQQEMIEATGSLPLSNMAINLLSAFRESHPAWGQTLQYLPFARALPSSPNWGSIQPLFSDIAWQLKQFNLGREKIPAILADADQIVSEISQP